MASQLPQPTPEQIKAAKEKFEQGILARGEAVPAGQPLPPGATHEIVTPADGGPPGLERSVKRYSLALIPPQPPHPNNPPPPPL